MNNGFGISVLFVALWSTGFLGAKLGLPYAEPMTFLAIRFGIAGVVLALWVKFVGSRWLTWQQVQRQAIIGVLVHYVYLGGVFAGVALQVPAGIAAMIVGLQPIVTALVAWLILNDRLTRVQILGMALGFGGVLLVVLNKLDGSIGEPMGLALCFLALLGIAFGSILQKEWGRETPMHAGNALQFGVATFLCAMTAAAFETMNVQWAGEFIFALGWLVIVLSLGAVALLYRMIQRGAAAEVASLFFLVPPVTAFLAWLLFDEQLSVYAIVGMVLTAVGVALVNRYAVADALAKSTASNKSAERTGKASPADVESDGA